MKKHDILNIVYSTINDVSPNATKILLEINEDEQDIFFVDLGINSIDYAEIAYIVMSKLNVTKPIDIFTCTNRIQDVVGILYDVIHQANTASNKEFPAINSLENRNLASAVSI